MRIYLLATALLLFIHTGMANQSQHAIAAVPYSLEQNNTLGSVSIQSEHITIVAERGSDLFTNTTGSESVNNIPYVAFEPTGDFIFSVKVTAQLNSAYSGAAIVVLGDDKHWAKLLFERFQSGQLGVATTVTQIQGDDAYHGTRETHHQYLKVARHDNSYVFYTSADGEVWEFIRHFALDIKAPAKIALAAQSPMAEALTVNFSDIRFKPHKFTDYWQGE